MTCTPSTYACLLDGVAGRFSDRFANIDVTHGLTASRRIIGRTCHWLITHRHAGPHAPPRRRRHEGRLEEGPVRGGGPRGFSFDFTRARRHRAYLTRRRLRCSSSPTSPRSGSARPWTPRRWAARSGRPAWAARRCVETRRVDGVGRPKFDSTQAQRPCASAPTGRTWRVRCGASFYITLRRVARAGRAFSLILDKRTLDIEMDSEPRCTEFYEHIKALVAQAKLRRSFAH